MITKKELYDIIHEYINPELDKCTVNGGYWTHVSRAGFFYWRLSNGSSAWYTSIGSSIIKEDGEIIGFDIYNSYSSNKGYANIRIRKDSVEFVEDSKFDDFDHDFMYGLYEKIKEYVNKDVIVVETSHALITDTELHDIIHEYIKPELDKCVYWSYSSGAGDGFFCWYLRDHPSYSNAYISSRIIKEDCEIIGFDIYNGYSLEDNLNIKIRKDEIEFIEDSEFKDFSHDFMYGLYMKIKEYCGGIRK